MPKMRALRQQWRAVGLACGTLIAMLLASDAPRAASPAWARKGSFEVCLESSLEKWLGEQAAREVNDDPAVPKLGDTEVLQWTAETMAQCRSRGEAADKTSVENFTAYMAEWRRHVYDVASDIRKKGQSD